MGLLPCPPKSYADIGAHPPDCGGDTQAAAQPGRASPGQTPPKAGGRNPRSRRGETQATLARWTGHPANPASNPAAGPASASLSVAAKIAPGSLGFSPSSGSGIPHTHRPGAH